MRRTLWLLVLLAVLGLALAARYRLRNRHRWGPTVLVLAPQAAWDNVTPAQRRGFGVLLKDCMEYSGGLTLVEQEAVLPWKAGTLDTLTIRVHRMGDQIRILLQRQRQGHPAETLETGFEPPQKAMASALAALEVEDEAARVILPRNPEAFWALAGVVDWRVEENLVEAMAVCAGLVEREPEAAAVWLTKARVTDLFLLTNPTTDNDTQQQCEGDFLRALDLAPDYPRAVTSFARFRTDIGNQRGALEALFAAIRHYPKVPRLFEGVAYAARSAGLLDGALSALKQRDLILGPSRGESGLSENTYLYAGDLDTFEAILGPGSDEDADSFKDFYRGYTRLLRGDRAGAERNFSRAYFHPSGIPQFETLAEVYRLGLQGQTPAALAVLRRLWADRVPLRVPDGEYTFKLAEAFGFLGSPREAQEVATRAFSQGFGCTRWYERSPFLEGIRNTPRWNALQQHLQDRQMLAEHTFPKERFSF
jgi:tetratricopeptide (TPR) repeat protein